MIGCRLPGGSGDEWRRIVGESGRSEWRSLLTLGRCEGCLPLCKCANPGRAAAAAEEEEE